MAFSACVNITWNIKIFTSAAIFNIIYNIFLYNYPGGKSNIVDKCKNVRRAKVKEWEQGLLSEAAQEESDEKNPKSFIFKSPKDFYKPKLTNKTVANETS